MDASETPRDPDPAEHPARTAPTLRTGPDPVVELRGGIAPDLVAYVRRKVEVVLGHTRRAALHVHVRVVRHADPARDRPVSARALIDLAGRPLHVHVEATTPREAVDLLLDRLDRRIAGTARGHRRRGPRVTPPSPSPVAAEPVGAAEPGTGEPGTEEPGNRDTAAG